MKIITNFDFKLNKNMVMNMLKSYHAVLSSNNIDVIYERLLPVLYESVQPIGIFSIDQKDENFTFDIISNYNYIIHCIVTIGDKCTEIIDNFFSNEKIEEAMILDTMATSFLFDISSQLFNHVYDAARQKGLGLSCRIAPGDGEIPLWYQDHIINKLNAEGFLKIHMLDSGMLSSLRCMTYIYGADKQIALNNSDHNCHNCSSRNRCTMKKI